MILAIDPSFTGTGLALASDDGTILKTGKLSVKGACYSSITDNHNACEEIIDGIKDFIKDVSDVEVICEYPAFATRSGAYLAVLNGALSSRLKRFRNVRSITWVPPNACNSFTKNKLNSKSFLVEWCKREGLVSKRTSHDECTAIIFVRLLLAIRSSKYKNSFFVWKRI